MELNTKDEENLPTHSGSKGSTKSHQKTAFKAVALLVAALLIIAGTLYAMTPSKPTGSKDAQSYTLPSQNHSDPAVIWPENFAQVLQQPLIALQTMGATFKQHTKALVIAAVVLAILVAVGVGIWVYVQHERAIREATEAIEAAEEKAREEAERIRLENEIEAQKVDEKQSFLEFLDRIRPRSFLDVLGYLYAVNAVMCILYTPKYLQQYGTTSVSDAFKFMAFHFVTLFNVIPAIIKAVAFIFYFPASCIGAGDNAVAWIAGCIMGFCSWED